MKVGFHTLGCKVNQYETDACAALFETAGFEVAPFDEICDIYVINTCSVTNIGDRKSRQAIRRARAQNPNAKIIAMGCYAQSAGDALIDETLADVVMGTNERIKIVEYAKEYRKSFVDETPREYEELSAGSSGERCRAYVKIQDGCDNFCSYCIVPYTRGRSRSRDFDAIVEEAARLAKEYNEIVLTGVDVADYGKNTGKSLIDVIEAVCAIDSVRRVRLSSIDPEAFTDGFIARAAEQKKLCRHFHISLQSGSDGVLKKMNRHYTAQEYLDILQKLRAAMPDCFITTDIIAGFAEETEEQHKETLEFVKKAGFLKVHVFPYSERSGTAAAKRTQIPMNVRVRRAKEISTLADSIAKEVENSVIGVEQEVLFEQSRDGEWDGLTKGYVRVFVKSGEDLAGKIRRVMPIERKNEKIYAKLLTNCDQAFIIITKTK